LFPKFVSEHAETHHELWKRGPSAADLKFLHHPLGQERQIDQPH
jgi:hypothetical protein